MNTEGAVSTSVATESDLTVGGETRKAIREKPAFPVQKRAYTIPEAAFSAGCSTAHLYRQIRLGKLVLRKAGRRSLILAKDLQAFLEQLDVRP